MSTADLPADPIRSILVPTDGSAAAGAAFERALRLATLEDATLHVLSVVDTSTNPMKFGVAEVDELDRATQRVVDELLDAHGDRAVDLSGTVRRGRPASAILEYADEEGADLIVMGRTGREGVADAVLGSTADRVVRQSPVPVVVVPGASEG